MRDRFVALWKFFGVLLTLVGPAVGLVAVIAGWWLQEGRLYRAGMVLLVPWYLIAAVLGMAFLAPSWLGVFRETIRTRRDVLMWACSSVPFFAALVVAILGPAGMSIRSCVVAFAACVLLPLAALAAARLLSRVIPAGFGLCLVLILAHAIWMDGWASLDQQSVACTLLFALGLVLAALAPRSEPPLTCSGARP
jgi:hypothetical protein